MYWAQSVAAQTEDPELAARFASLASTLAENETQIIGELAAAQGKPVETLGDSYYYADRATIRDVMRPSAILNASLAKFNA